MIHQCSLSSLLFARFVKMSRLLVLLLTVFSSLENITAEAISGIESDLNANNVHTYCTVAEMVTIKSMKTGEYITGDVSGETLTVHPEETADNKYWEVLAGNGFFIFKNVNTSNIMDVLGGCYEGMIMENVISYRQEEVAPNNRFYINPMDHTIGVQCPGGGKLRVKIQDLWVVVETIDNPKTSDDDIHFAIERVHR